MKKMLLLSVFVALRCFADIAIPRSELEQLVSDGDVQQALGQFGGDMSNLVTANNSIEGSPGFGDEKITDEDLNFALLPDFAGLQDTVECFCEKNDNMTMICQDFLASEGSCRKELTQVILAAAREHIVKKIKQSKKDKNKA